MSRHCSPYRQGYKLRWTCLTTLKKLTLSIVNKFPLRSLNRFFLFPPFETFQPVEGYFLLPQAARKDIKTNYV